MPDRPLPKEVRELVARRLRSIEEIEVLLLLSGAEGALSAPEIRERLRMPESEIPPASLDRLVAAELVETVTQSNVPCFRYAPRTSDLRRAVDLLAVAYNERPVTLIRLVYHTPSSTESFTDAFRNDD